MGKQSKNPPLQSKYSISQIGVIIQYGQVQVRNIIHPHTPALLRFFFWLLQLLEKSE
jgi:hypothetical protein